MSDHLSPRRGADDEDVRRPGCDALTFAFGAFQLIPARQLLLHQGARVRIGCRALDLLTALVERPGELMMKQELMARVWPSTTVDEGNLKVNVAALRRALDDDPRAASYIATVPGRGYRFVAPVATASLRVSALRGVCQNDFQQLPLQIMLVDLDGQDATWIRAALALM